MRGEIDRPGAGEQLDSLIAALKAAARDFGRPSSETVLFSGIPYPRSRAEADDFIERVCQRSGLVPEPLERSSLRSGRIDPPAIVELQDGTYAYLSASEQGGNAASARKARHGFRLSQFYSNSQERAAIGIAGQIERPHWFLGPASAFWRGYIAVAVAAMLVNILALASPLFIMNVYDRILPNNATSSLLALAVGVGLAMIFDLLFKTARATIIDRTGREIDQRVSYSLFDKVLHTRLSAQSGSTGEYASRVSQVEFVREFFTSNTIATLIDAIFVFVFVFVIYLVAGWIAIIPAVAFAIAILFGLIAHFRIGKLVARAANEAARRQSLLVESISTLETIKSLRAESQLLRSWADLTRAASKTSERIKHLSSNAANLTQFVQQVVTIAIIIAGAYEFANGNMTTGGIIATVMLSNRTVAPLTQIAMTLARMRQAILSLRILNSIMKQEEDRPSSTGFVNREIQSGSFAFQDVTFSYPGTDAKVLRNVNLNVRPGERVGIIGKIGSGKTTLGRLLVGFYEPTEGRILVDGIDVRQYHPAELRRATAYAGQSVDLFSGTLKENLRLANPDATDQEIIEAAKKTGVDEFASAHPRGYDLAVGERGSNLSGGQKQAVAMTRLLLSQPRIVFLDEPSGALDLGTERQLIGSLSRSFGPDVTLVISTHRYSLLELVDRLVVLDRGRIIADGPKDAVMKALEERARAAGAAAARNQVP